MSDNPAGASPRKDRDEKGKFIQGHKVPSPRSGRLRKADHMPILYAVTQAAYSPEDLVEMLHETYRVAAKAEDAKAMMQVIQFVVNYAIGKPVQRTLTASIDPDKLKELFGDSDDEDDGGITIDGGVVE